jgi:hypothetical protein
MVRIGIAVVAGLGGFGLYLAGALVLADRVATQHWAVQGLFYLVAGVLWVLPAHFLVLWAGRK